MTVGKAARIAVTTRGNHGIGRRHAQRFCDAADQIGVDLAMKAFEEALPSLASKPENDGCDYLHWHVCAWSETRGLVRFSAHNLPFAFADKEAPLKVHQLAPAGGYYAANNASMQTLMECGVRPPDHNERLGAYLKRMGGALMEAQRRTPANLLADERSAEPQYLIGGQCDLTIVTREGVSVETIKTWPDRIGEKIEPLSEAGNVVRLPRHKRRAMGREARRLARRSA